MPSSDDRYLLLEDGYQVFDGRKLSETAGLTFGCVAVSVDPVKIVVNKFGQACGPPVLDANRLTKNEKPTTGDWL